MLTTEVISSILMPFVGTCLGACCVFFMKKDFSQTLQRILLGFAGGVMVAASVWSLVIPALEYSTDMGKWSFVPAVVGIWLGIMFLLLLDKIIPHLHMNSDEAEGVKTNLPKSAMLMLAVALHNLPEGVAVGVVIAGGMADNTGLSLAGAMTLALGIAIQNFPEGAIISMPLRGEGLSKGKAFLWGVLSGLVEPLAAICAILLAGFVSPLLPWMLGFAAGAMLYVVVEELIPEMSAGEHSNIGTIAFAAGFTLMIVLDVALG